MSICHLERQGDIAILAPTEDLGEFVYEDFEATVDATLGMLEKGEVTHVVVDFGRTDYFGSHAITLMMQLGKKVRSLGGKMALSGLSAHEKEILKKSRLDTYWLVQSSREAATKAITSPDASNVVGATHVDRHQNDVAT